MSDIKDHIKKSQPEQMKKWMLLCDLFTYDRIYEDAMYILKKYGCKNIKSETFSKWKGSYGMYRYLGYSFFCSMTQLKSVVTRLKEYFKEEQGGDYDYNLDIYDYYKATKEIKI